MSAFEFLRDVRARKVALRGRLKKNADALLAAFEAGLFASFPEAADKAFARSLSKLWARWLDSRPNEGDPAALSLRKGRESGEILKREYADGLAGGLAAFLLDKRLHLTGVDELLRMRGWLLETIERLRRDPDPAARERGEILDANFASIVLRAQHHAGPGYAAEAAARLGSMLGELDAAIRNLSSIEPEAASYLRSNRATVITRALHSGFLDYGNRVKEALPSALKKLDPNLSNRRTVVYRAITNGTIASRKNPFST
ncbi:MAG TPA: hypothetical protein VFX30_11380 [bacterium]|nr:hypothetical protein [bacterium]